MSRSDYKELIFSPHPFTGFWQYHLKSLHKRHQTPISHFCKHLLILLYLKFRYSFEMNNSEVVSKQFGVEFHLLLNFKNARQAASQKPFFFFFLFDTKCPKRNVRQATDTIQSGRIFSSSSELLITLVLVSVAHRQREAVDREGEHNGGALLGRDRVQRLEVSQLQRRFALLQD